MTTTTIEMLDYRESAALEMLRRVNTDSIWGEAIKKVLSNYSVARFRLLISSLLSQNDDNPTAMRRILGPAYQSVITLKSINNQHSHGNRNKIKGREGRNQDCALAKEKVCGHGQK